MILELKPPERFAELSVKLIVRSAAYAISPIAKNDIMDKISFFIVFT